jgi:peptide deformylase
MTILPVIIAPDPRLKVKCPPVDAVDDQVRRLMDDMLETMYHVPGIGLAAPQVGVHKRVIVVDASRKDEDPAPLKLANPELVWASDELGTYEEGCLSLPEYYAEVTRPNRVRVRYLDYEGEIREIEAEGVFATCIQHEMDHLDGVLFVDHISSLKRSIILRKLAKSKRAEAKASA